MTPFYLLSVQLSVFCATALFSVWFMTRTTPAARRLYGVTRLVPDSAHSPSRNARSAQEATFRFLHGVFGRMGMTVSGKLQARFRASGLRSQNGIDVYFAVRLLGPVAVLLLWTFFRQIGFFPITIMAAGAYLGPDIWLTARTKRRREQIRLGLPDALDLMVVCVDAGLGLDQALLRTGQELGSSHPVIAEEFMLINLEQRAGKPRINAWRDMADRTQLETVRGFATMLAQSDRFGTPISKALSTFADDLRKKRSQQAQEMAAKTTVKLMFPLVLFIFPSMFIVLLGPAVLTISRNLGALTGK
jgi:tight adherence protein C